MQLCDRKGREGVCVCSGVARRREGVCVCSGVARGEREGVCAVV